MATRAAPPQKPLDAPSPRILSLEAGDDDPFDTADFDVLHYVNQLFPTEDSLAELPSVASSLRLRIARVDSEILQAVRRQSRTGSRARRELREASETAGELFARLESVRQRAAAAERLVRVVCRDVRALDAAKLNLTETVASLRRLGMLIDATDALQRAADAGDLGEAARLLSAVQALSERFAPYAHVPRVAELRGRISGLEAGLKAAALREFRTIGGASSSGPGGGPGAGEGGGGADPPADPRQLEALSAACSLINTLGYAVRDEAIDGTIRREMGSYTAIFGTLGDTARLERTVNRYKWLLRRLDARSALWRAFPPDWRVPQLLAISFCNVTRSSLAEILDARGAELRTNLEPLLRAVEATNIFEAELARRFGEGDDEGEGDEDGDEDDGEGGGVGRGGGDGAAGSRRPPSDHTERSASEIRARYEAGAARRRAAAEATAAAGMQGDEAGSEARVAAREHAASAAVRKARFRGAIGPVFEPYLGLYVSGVEADLRVALDRMLAAEPWEPLAAGTNVLASAGELTDALRAELRDCAARVTRGAGLVALAAAFGRVYEDYAARLVARLPRPAQGPPMQPTPLGGTAWLVSAAARDEEAACLIAGTAAHCERGVGELARAVDARVRPRSLRGRSANARAEDALRAAGARALVTLALSARSRLEAPLLALSRLDWAREDPPDDASPPALQAARALEGTGARLARLLDPPQRRFVLDRLQRSFGAAVAEAVARCRRISDAGCQQLRLDLDALRAVPLDLARDADLAPEDYEAFAEDAREAFAAAEAELKVVGAPAPALAATYASLFPDGDAAHLARLLDMKLLRKAEAAQALDEYQRKRKAPGGGGGGRGTPAGPSPASAAASPATAAPPRGPSPTPPPRYSASASDMGALTAPRGPPPGEAAAAPRGLAAPVGAPDGAHASPGVAGAAQPPPPGLPTFRPNLDQANLRAAEVAQAARVRMSAGAQAARASASAAGDSVRETMGRTLGAMKNLRFMNRD